MRILVTGSRTWKDRETVEKALACVVRKYPEAVIIHGGARGADRLAAEFCAQHQVQCVEYRPDWESHGPRAGLLRNLAMLSTGVDAVVGFWDGESRGTAHALSVAHRRSIPIWLFKAEA